MSRKPLSSTKTRWAPSASLFFYPGPLLLLPAGDGGLVAFQGPPLGLLATPAEAGQELPHVAGVVGHPEVALDHGGHPLEGPEVGGVACSQGTLQEQFHQLLFLPRGEPGRPPGRRPGAQLFQGAP